MRARLLSGLFWALVLVGLGIAMIVTPDAMIDSEEPTRARGRGLYWILKTVWSMPGGIVSLLLGLLVGGFTIKNNDTE